MSTYSNEAAKELAQCVDDGDVEVSSMDSVNKHLCLARNAMYEVVKGYNYVLRKHKKIFAVLSSKTDEEMLDTLSESDTDILDVLQNLDEAKKQAKFAIAFHDERKQALEQMSNGWSDPPPPELAEPLKAFLKDFLDFALSFHKLVSRLDKEINGMMGPLGA